jgi:RNA polymerase sigma-70 factor (ECF subfamily)
MDDVDLLRRIAAGDRDAFETFYRRYESRLYSYLITQTQQHDRAEDLIIETMVAVWRGGAARFEGRSTVFTWLVRIARNKFSNDIRRESRPNEVIVDRDALQSIRDPASDLVERHARAQLVRKCWEALSVAQRTVMELVFVQGSSYKESGAMAGCPEGTVKRRIFDGRAQLKKCLEQHGLSLEDR